MNEGPWVQVVPGHFLLFFFCVISPTAPPPLFLYLHFVLLSPLFSLLLSPFFILPFLFLSISFSFHSASCFPFISFYYFFFISPSYLFLFSYDLHLLFLSLSFFINAKYYLLPQTYVYTHMVWLKLPLYSIFLATTLDRELQYFLNIPTFLNFSISE